jgi:hypothetical protein
MRFTSSYDLNVVALLGPWSLFVDASIVGRPRRGPGVGPRSLLHCTSCGPASPLPACPLQGHQGRLRLLRPPPPPKVLERSHRPGALRYGLNLEVNITVKGGTQLDVDVRRRPPA